MFLFNGLLQSILRLWLKVANSEAKLLFAQSMNHYNIISMSHTDVALIITVELDIRSFMKYHGERQSRFIQNIIELTVTLYI